VAKTINSSEKGKLPQTEEMDDAAEVSPERLSERTEEGQLAETQEYMALDDEQKHVVAELGQAGLTHLVTQAEVV
jgi:hypothetical protein